MINASIAADVAFDQARTGLLGLGAQTLTATPIPWRDELSLPDTYLGTRGAVFLLDVIG